jgi:hypothetical protein
MRRCRTVGPRRAPTVRGAGKTIRARLESGERRPIAGAEVAVLEEPRAGGGPRRVTRLRTDRLGTVRHRVSRGPSRTIRLEYGGTPLIKPAVTQLKVLVPARTTITVSRRFLRNGESVRFAGRLAGGPVPEGGKLIDLQAHYRGRWRTFATPRTDGAGRWRFRYRFEATRGLVVYRFRARIRREAAYPYELGHSRTVAVTVRGP